MSVAEHATVLQTQIAFQNSTIDIVRRQLLSMAIVISNLAQATKRERMEVDKVSECLSAYYFLWQR